MFVVTLPPSAVADPLSYAKRAKREGADILEIRTDLTSEVQPFTSPLPLLLSLRSDDLSLLGSLKPRYIDCDVHPPALKTLKLPKGTKLVLSFHNYDKTPALGELKKLVQKMYSSKPWMIKVATQIVSYKDLSVLLDLQSLLNKKSIRSTVLGMGPKAHLTRTLSPLRNTFTYTYLSDGQPVALGQLPLSFHKLLKGRKKPKIYGLLGGPQAVSSLSPIIQNALFLRHKVDAVYSCFPTYQFSPTLKELKKIGIAGLSVTSPFKHDAFLATKKRSGLASRLSVANTLVSEKGSFYADNTDVLGIHNGYPALASAKRVAIFGAGGAAAAAIEAVKSVNPYAEVTVFVRDIVKAEQHLSGSGVTVRPLPVAQTATADAVIFAITSDISLPLPKPTNDRAIAIDLRYGSDTAFLKDAKAAGYQTFDGIPMLIHQALGQFELFTGKKPKKGDVEYLHSILSAFP